MDYPEEAFSENQEEIKKIENQVETPEFIGSGTENNTESNLPSTSGMKAANRKRKFNFNTNDVGPKKSRNFCYIGATMTKPRRAKLSIPHSLSTQKDKNVGVGQTSKSYHTCVDDTGSIYLKQKSFTSPEVVFYEERKYTYEPSKVFDLAFHIIDEIALEGLDGITIEALWKRLKFVFPNHITQKMADRIWRFICNNKKINLFVLKDPREELVYYDCCKTVDPDSNPFEEPLLATKDIYPLSVITAEDVKGSCSEYTTRKENNGIRKFSLEKALKLYDQKLVMVADQTLRTKSLINEEADPSIEFLDFDYCILEKIGRTRAHGEISQIKTAGKEGRNTYHIRKTLSQQRLITNQNCFFKSTESHQPFSNRLIHLTRFYHKRKAKSVTVLERVAQILKSRSSQQMELSEFKEIFGPTMGKLLKSPEFRQFFKLMIVPYRKLYPQATRREYLLKSQKKEKEIKIIKMLDPKDNVSVLMDCKEIKASLPDQTITLPGNKSLNQEYLRDIFDYIFSSGLEGVTVQDMFNYFRTDFYSLRLGLRKLLVRNLISSYKIDLGKQQCYKFFAKSFKFPNICVKTDPGNFELPDETLSEILKGYATLDKDTKFYTEPEQQPEVSLAMPDEFKLEFEPFCCSVFITETIDPSSEELTIYDIVIKGRDKLLLIHSNLFIRYVSEFDELLLKSEPFTRKIPLFRNGIGKVIYEFLTTVQINLQTDNRIIFNLDEIKKDTKVSITSQGREIISIPKNYNYSYSSKSCFDSYSKAYLFHAMFNEFHRSNQTIVKLKKIFNYAMLLEGKKNIGINKESVPETDETSNNPIVMEKFMGETPELVWRYTEGDLNIEIFLSTPPSQIQEMQSFTEDGESPRYIHRANKILELVNQHKIEEFIKLYHKIWKGEVDSDTKACKRSIVTIISRLVSDGYVKCYKILLTGKNLVKSRCFVCAHEVNHHNNTIMESVDQLKLRFYVTPNTSSVIAVKAKCRVSGTPFSNNEVKNSITELKQLVSVKISSLAMRADSGRDKLYGYSPKFVRMKVLHHLLFHIVRGNILVEPLPEREVYQLCKDLDITPEDFTNMPPVYCKEVSWKMFVTPLSQMGKWPKGWILGCDLMLRMPLVTFLQLFHVPYDIPELETYLSHPLKKYYLLKQLPGPLRSALLHKRKYLQSVYDTVNNLCYIGLLQLGPRSNKEKDQVFIYVNSKASLLDTTSSMHGYNKIEKKEYRRISYEFRKLSDVDFYWSEMLRICMSTPLGKRKILDGQFVTIEDCQSKMIGTLTAKTFNQALQDDTGKIPGDGQGSAGFDSSVWSFVRRNWYWGSKTDKINKIQTEFTGSNEPEIPNPIPYKDLSPKVKKNKVSPQKPVVVKNKRMKVYLRKIALKKKRARQYCDALDREIMKKNPGFKVEWDEEEDQLLRYSRTASVFLCPFFKKQFIPYSILRDVLHRLNPKSRNKTAPAIQRRMYVLLTNDETLKIMIMNVENLLRSNTIAKFFGKVHSRYKNGIRIKDAQIYICFIYLMCYFSKHKKEVELLLLGCSASCDFLSQENITDFQAMVKQNYTKSVPIYKNPESLEDIVQDTIKTIIHCSMSCRRNSIGWTHNLSLIYKKFKEDVIRDTVTLLRKHQFFVLNKNATENQVGDNWFAPIKFSHVYKQMKAAPFNLEVYKEAFRNFVNLVKVCKDSNINFTVYTEVGSFWEQIYFDFDVPEMGIILDPKLEDHSEVVDELAQRFRLYLQQINQKTNEGKSEGADSSNRKDKGGMEKSLDEIKEEVRQLIFRVPYLLEGELEDAFRKMLDSSEMMEVNSYIFLMISHLYAFACNIITLEELKSFIREVENKSCDSERLVENLSKVVFSIQNTHLHEHDAQYESGKSIEEVFMIWESEIWDEVRPRSEIEKRTKKMDLMRKEYTSIMASCVKRARDGDIPSLEEIKEGIMLEGKNEDRKIPHITDLIMLLTVDRFPERDSDIEKIEKLKTHFIIQLPMLNECRIEDIDDFQQHESIKQILQKEKFGAVDRKLRSVAQDPQLNLIIFYVRDKAGSFEDLKIVENLIDFIRDKKELGASAEEIKRVFKDHLSLNLEEFLCYLCDINVVLRAGVTRLLFVHYEYQTEWLTETYISNVSDDLEIDQDVQESLREKINKVQLKPWTKLDGSLNNNVFYDWLTVVFCKCTEFPNIPFKSLCEQFFYLKPVDIYSLLEILQEIGCIEIHVLEATDHNVFSKREIIQECKATCLDNFDYMFIKPTNISGLCYGSFLEDRFIC